MDSINLLSVRQPHATLICSALKTVENRAWNTKFRGKIYIHASSIDNNDLFDEMYPLPLFHEYNRCFDLDGNQIKKSKILTVKSDRLVLKNKAYIREYRLLKTEISKQLENDTLFCAHSIVGMVDIVDVIQNSKSP